MPLGDVGVFESEARINDRSPDHLVRRHEIVIIVTVGTSERCHRCHGCSAPAGAARTLLIIRPSRRHVSQRNAGQLADVNPDFHGRGAGKHVDRGFMRVRIPPCEVDILKAHFVIFGLRKHILHLCRIELRGVFSGDQGNERGFAFCQRFNDGRPVISTACHKDVVRIRIKGLDPSCPTINAGAERFDRPMNRLACRTPAPGSADI